MAGYLFLFLRGAEMATGTRHGKNHAARKEKEQQNKVALADLIASADSSGEDTVNEIENPVERPMIDVGAQQSATATAAMAGSPALILSAQEKAFIREMRTNIPAVDANELPQPPEASADEKAYAGVLGSVSAFSRVHGHCLGLLKLSPRNLRKQVLTYF